MHKEIRIKTAAGGDGRDFVDRSKLRITTRLMFGMIRIGITDENFIGDVSKYKIGPVRGAARQWIGIKLPLGMKPPKMYGDIYSYGTMIFMVSRNEVSFNPKYLLTDFNTILGYDLHHPNGYGMQLTKKI